MDQQVRQNAIAALVALSLPAGLCAQTSPSSFQSVEIHTSAPNTIPEMRVSFSRGRYELRNATAVDLIRTAWSVDPADVVGGPEWLDTDRFDVLAIAPANATPDQVHAMLQQFLEDRFQLSVHKGTRDRPAYALIPEKTTHLQRANGLGPSGCDVQPGPPVPRGAPQPPVSMLCGNVTIQALANALANAREASGYLLDLPVLDRTGFSGIWNLRLQWSARNVFLAAAAPPAEVTLFEAFEKQLGLKLKLIQEHTPAVFVDQVKRPQTTGVAAPRAEFEVAEIRPADPGDPSALPCGRVDIQPGGRVNIDMTLRQLILETQGDFNTHRIAFARGVIASLDSPCWQIVAKAPVQEDAPAGWNGAVWNGVDIGTMRRMLRSLLEDRFRLKAHTEDRPVPGFALVAAKPKLPKGDSANRPGCSEGPPPNVGSKWAAGKWKDPRSANPLASRLVTCLNMTVTQFVDEMNRSNVGVGGPVVDATGLQGRYDFTVNFSPPSVFANPPGLGTAGPIPQAAEPAPAGAISIFDALKTQLGLKLESRSVPAPVLIVDHIDSVPAGN